jgi:hypothetical protein
MNKALEPLDIGMLGRCVLDDLVGFQFMVTGSLRITDM